MKLHYDSSEEWQEDLREQSRGNRLCAREPLTDGTTFPTVPRSRLWALLNEPDLQAVHDAVVHDELVAAAASSQS